MAGAVAVDGHGGPWRDPRMVSRRGATASAALWRRDFVPVGPHGEPRLTVWRERDLEELGRVEEILRADDPLVANQRTTTREVEMGQPRPRCLLP